MVGCVGEAELALVAAAAAAVAAAAAAAGEMTEEAIEWSRLILMASSVAANDGS